METVIEQIAERLEAIIAGSSLFLTDVRIKPTNNIKVFIDGDEGVTIDAISKVNRALYKQIEEAGWFPEGDFSLEVSSPGVDEPLKFFRQYKKNIGREVLVTLHEGEQLRGKLIQAEPEQITLEPKAGRKKNEAAGPIEIPFERIQTTVVQITF